MIRFLGLLALVSWPAFGQTLPNVLLEPQIPGQTNLWRLQWQSALLSDTAVVQILRTTPSGNAVFLENTFSVIPEQFRTYNFALESTKETYTVILTEYKGGPSGFLEGRATFNNIQHFVEPNCPSLFSPVVDFNESDLHMTVAVLNLGQIQQLAEGRVLRFHLSVTGPLGSTRTYQSNNGTFAFEGIDGDGEYTCVLTYTLDGEISFETRFEIEARETDKRVVIPRVSGIGRFESILALNRLRQQTRLRLTLHSDLGFSASVNFDLFSYNQFEDRAVAVNISNIFGELAGPLEIQEETSSSYRRHGDNRIIARSFIFSRQPLQSKRSNLFDLFTPTARYNPSGPVLVPNLPENAEWIEYLNVHALPYALVGSTVDVAEGIGDYELQKMEEQPATVIWSSGLILEEFNAARGVHARIQNHENPYDGEWLVALNLSNADGRFDVRLDNRNVGSITLLPRQSSLIHLTTQDDGIDRPGFFQIVTAPNDLALIELHAINNTYDYVYAIITVSGNNLAVQPF